MTRVYLLLTPKDKRVHKAYECSQKAYMEAVFLTNGGKYQGSAPMTWEEKYNALPEDTRYEVRDQCVEQSRHSPGEVVANEILKQATEGLHRMRLESHEAFVTLDIQLILNEAMKDVSSDFRYDMAEYFRVVGCSYKLQESEGCNGFTPKRSYTYPPLVEYVRKHYSEQCPWGPREGGLRGRELIRAIYYASKCNEDRNLQALIKKAIHFFERDAGTSTKKRQKCEEN